MREPSVHHSRRTGTSSPSPNGAVLLSPPNMVTIRPNFALMLTTLPIMFVLLALPILQGIEEAKLGHERATLEERVAVLAQHQDFVVHAATRLIWRRDPAIKVPELKGGEMHCTRLSPEPHGGNLTSKNNNKDRPRIRIVRVVGERNAGVQTLRGDMQRALRNVTVEAGVTRWVFWFQDPGLQTREDRAEANETLVVHVALDPYEWIARMLVNPIHAPYHRMTSQVVASSGSSSSTTTTTGTGNKNHSHGHSHHSQIPPGSIAEPLFSRAWTVPRPEWDDPHPQQGRCQYKYPVDGVIPCSAGKFSGNRASRLYPVYEMNPRTLRPFKNVALLRTAKLVNHLNISSWMPHVIHVRSADVASVHGVNTLIIDLMRHYRFSGACEVTKRDRKIVALALAQQAGSGGGGGGGGGSGGGNNAVGMSTPWAEYTVGPHGASWSESTAPPLSRAQERWVTCNTNWYVEKEFGYEPKEDPDVVCPHGRLGRGGPYDDAVERASHPVVGSESQTGPTAVRQQQKSGFFYRFFDEMARRSSTTATRAPSGV